MEARNNQYALLDLMECPAFSVEDGIVSHVNPAAGIYLLPTGTPIDTLLRTGHEEYAAFTEGCLYVTLQLGQQQLGASITRVNDMDIVIPEQPANAVQLQAFALAAQALREPLAGIMAITEHILPVRFADADADGYTAQLNRRLYQMLRMVGNMSDATVYTEAAEDHMESTQICAMMQELLDRVQQQLQAAGIALEYTLPQKPIDTCVDREKLERAVYNLISNAIKHAPDSKTIRVTLEQSGQRLYLSVIDKGQGMDAANPYTRFMRMPALEEARFGIGLGMVIVRATAALHGGAVLFDRPAGGGHRVTLSLALRQTASPVVRSPVLQIDYTGEREHGLVELSDVLPLSVYQKEQIK